MAIKIIDGDGSEVYLQSTGSGTEASPYVLTTTAGASSGTTTVQAVRASAATTTSVADTASSTTLLAANTNRLGASIYNDSTVTLYVKLGATASATSFAVKMTADTYFEVPFGYTGIIDGIWASDAAGSARIVEFT